MNSRSILFAAGFCLACMIVLGSAAMQLAVGDARTHEQHGGSLYVSGEDEAGQAENDPEAALQEGLSASRKLEALLRHAEALMEVSQVQEDSLTSTGSIPLTEEVVAVFAEMVQIIDERAGHRFEVVIGDPDPEASLRRAEIIRSALLLALRHPSRLRITESLSSRPQLRVRAIETPGS